MTRCCAPFKIVILLQAPGSHVSVSADDLIIRAESMLMQRCHRSGDHVLWSLYPCHTLLMHTHTHTHTYTHTHCTLHTLQGALTVHYRGVGFSECDSKDEGSSPDTQARN